MISLQTEVADRVKELAAKRQDLEKHKKNNVLGSFFGNAETKKLEQKVQEAALKLTGSKLAQKTAVDKLNRLMEAGKKKPVPDAYAAQLDHASEAELASARGIFDQFKNARVAQEYLLKFTYSPGSTEPRNRLKSTLDELQNQVQNGLHPEVFGLVLAQLQDAHKQVQMYVRTYLADQEQNQPHEKERRAELETPRA